MDRKFLEDLKVGDNVGIKTHYYGFRLEKVKRITKTMIVTEGYRFKRETGFSMGDGYTINRLVELTPEFYDTYYRQVYTNGIKRMIENSILEKLSINELKEICLKLKEKK